MAYGIDEDKGSNIQEYFAAGPADMLAADLLQRSTAFFQTMKANLYLTKLAANWRFYHGIFVAGFNTDHQVSFTGEQGELVNLPVNHFRNIARNMYVMITTNRPSMEARAINTDYKSLAQATLANGILEYYMREKGLEDVIKSAAEMAIVLGSAFVKMEWNAEAGETYEFDPDTGEYNYEGELEFNVLSPFDVIFDGTKSSWSNEWLMTRTFKNKFDIAAKYPELKEKILSVPATGTPEVWKLSLWSNDKTDDIPVYEFFHKRTTALPDGRYVLFVGSDIILLDMPMPYRNMPVFRIAPENYIGTPYGYTPMFDVYPIQEAINSLASSMMTNQEATATQNVWVPRGSDIDVAALQGGMNIVTGNAKPEAIQLEGTAPSTFQMYNLMVQTTELITGVNSVVRGNPEANLKSGTALALVQSQALQFLSGMQQSYIKLIEDLGTSLIMYLKDFAKAPRTAAIVGTSNKTYLKEFTGDDLDSINRVVVDVGNPLSQCLKKDTPILMYDGSVKMVQDIIVGEQLMGPDSKPRTVTNVNTGEEQMYDVHHKSQKDTFLYGCNESHILSLKYCANDGKYGFYQYQPVDMSVKEFLSLPESLQNLFMGYRTGVEFEKKNLSIPPYILGAWLGDGHSATTCLTSADKELVDAWTEYAHSINLQVRIKEQENNKSKLYHITSGKSHGPSDRNHMMNALREMDLINNKHIPQNYLTTSREDRLQLLAGFIDTDGYIVDQTFIITQKSIRLADELTNLARSLGFKVTRSTETKTTSFAAQTEAGFSVLQKITIGGNTWEIPTKLPRKQSKEVTKHRDWLNYGIRLKPTGVDTYYGFSLKEEPHFLLADYTVTHNTTAGRVQMAEQLLQMKLLTTPDQYLQIINTGELDVAYENQTHELLLIKQENEQLMSGKSPIVSPLDRHTIHINEHKGVLADPDLRLNPNLRQAVIDHVQQHLDALRNVDPSLLKIIGEQPLAPAGGTPANQNPQQPPQASMAPAPMGGALQGLPQAPNPQQLAAHAGAPGLPKVPASALANPALQQQAMGNVRMHK